MLSLAKAGYTSLYNYGGAAETAKLHCFTDTAKTTLDNTHLSNAGAYKIASMIADETIKLGLSDVVDKVEISETKQNDDTGGITLGEEISSQGRPCGFQLIHHLFIISFRLPPVIIPDGKAKNVIYRKYCSAREKADLV